MARGEVPVRLEAHLAERRLEAGLTQQELADQVGVNRTTLSNWETGYSAPRLWDAVRVALWLGLLVEDIWEVAADG